MSGLRKTCNYDLFEMNDLNRKIIAKPLLLASMQQFGFMKSSPLQVVESENGKLQIIRGHHRFHYAKRLNLPVWYVIDDSNTDIHFLERDSRQSWSAQDFADSHEARGDEDYIILMDFKRKHGLTLGAAASLVGGESASSHNKIMAIKEGKFKRGDMTHANQVAKIIDYCRELGVPFATQATFVEALSAALRIPEFDIDVLCHRLKLHSGNMNHRGRKDEYLDEIEAIYNYMAKDKRMPVKFRALEVGKQRRATFGKRS